MRRKGEHGHHAQLPQTHFTKRFTAMRKEPAPARPQRQGHLRLFGASRRAQGETFSAYTQPQTSLRPTFSVR
jgi:hypothetical protein